MGKTRVFISSTCYDLSQIRRDLKDGIREMGHEPMLSEDKDFPIDPSLTSSENCINAVRNDADVFVLIIGNKYGHKLESGQSITNSEFLTAVEKGIPVYTFSLKQMVHLLPFWKNNRTADFSYIVDDNKVFEFLEDVREKRSKWNFEFETAQDILEILKSQLSILFKKSLESASRIELIDSHLVKTLSGKALKILVEKKQLYEIMLFFQMMQDELDKFRYLRKDCEHHVYFKSGYYIEDISSFANWQSEKISQLQKSIESLNRLFVAFDKYYGEPGVESDLDGLFYVAHRFAEYYSFLLNWVIDVRSADYSDDLDIKDYLGIMSLLPMRAIEQLESFPAQSINQIKTAQDRVSQGLIEKGTTVNLLLSLSIDEDVNRRLKNEMDRLIRLYR